MGASDGSAWHHETRNNRVAQAHQRGRQGRESAHTMLAIRLLSHEGTPQAEDECRVSHMHEQTGRCVLNCPATRLMPIECAAGCRQACGEFDGQRRLDRYFARGWRMRYSGLIGDPIPVSLRRQLP